MQLPGQRIPAAHRGGMGIRLPRRQRRRPTASGRCGPLWQYAWYRDNAANNTHPVGQKKPNAWGLYDMHGNVAEWCNDIYEPGYYAKSPQANPRGPADGEPYVLRGGALELPRRGLPLVGPRGRGPRV